MKKRKAVARKQKAAHTPGPWSVGHCKENVVDARGFCILDANVIAVLDNWPEKMPYLTHWASSKKARREMPEREAEANATLAAAAPELRAAAEKMEAAWFAGDTDALEISMNQLIAARAKAEGRA